ncbi:MAG: Aldose [Erysipelotrichaceae bacterium]|nr:MAG: Aldose [Erysipelotrichaceae bacterium]
MIKRYPYALHHQEVISLFILENDFLSVSILDYGATITSIIYKPLKRETVLGFKNFKDYLNQRFYLGSLVGRVANRIHSGKFSLNEKIYQLSMNGTHHLHGGKVGFDQKRFNSEMSDDSLFLTLHSKDGDQGYPGNLDLKISYALKGSSLIMTTTAMSDTDTLFDTTQHTYFNLNKDLSNHVLNHRLKFNSELFYEVEEDGCTGANKQKTIKTPFDFSVSKLIRDAMDFSHPQIKRAKGIDHYFLKKELNDLVFCDLSVDDLNLRVSTTLPGAHIYTGNYLGPIKHGSDYPFLIENGGICFETQHVPNSINFDLHEAPILKAHTLNVSTTIYEYNEGEPYEEKSV